jgi:CRP-like cAMP-binding protein
LVRTGHIASIPLFEGLPKSQQEALEAIAVKRPCGRGQSIFSEGDEGTGFFAVLSGRVKVFKVSPEGKEQIFHIFGPGEVFGEVSVFTGQGFPASAEAYEESSLLFFPRGSFIDLIRRDPSLALNMLALLSLRLRKFAALIDDLSLKEVPGRLAAYLLYLSGREKKEPDLIELDITKSELAGLLGTIPETLSRILTRMGRQGLIRSEGSRIRILDHQALEQIATEGRKLQTPNPKPKILNSKF